MTDTAPEMYLRAARLYLWEEPQWLQTLVCVAKYVSAQLYKTKLYVVYITYIPFI